MMALIRRHRDGPGDPLAPVLIRTIGTARPVTAITSPWPGVWVGEGCTASGVRAGTAVDPDVLEAKVSASGAFDIVLTEPLDLVRLLAIYNTGRDGHWHDSIMAYVLAELPDAFAQALAMNVASSALAGAMFAAAVYTHPVAECWPTDSTIWHAHAVVPGEIYCSDRNCTVRH